MNTRLRLIIGFCISVLCCWLFLRWDNGDPVAVDGTSYRCRVYDTRKNPIKIPYKDASPSVFNEHKWLLPCVVTTGVDVIGKLDDSDIKGAFEKPSDTIAMATRRYIEAIQTQMKDPKGGYDENAAITLKTLVRIEINKEDYLVPTFSTSLVRGSDSEMTVSLVKVGKDWKYTSIDREAVAGDIAKLDKISRTAVKLAEEGKIKTRPVEELK